MTVEPAPAGTLVPMNVTFSTPDGWFNYRVGAIIARDGRVLMAHGRDPFYYPVGGRVHVGESAEDAVRREVTEELGTAPESVRLTHLHENFFPATTAKPGGWVHEISLYFDVTMPADWELDPARESRAEGFTPDQQATEWFEWVPLDTYGDVRAYPEWLADELAHPQPGIRHFLTRE